ncbi:MAG TPA: DUF4375 domain-containing protein [Actinomycetes bacterium]|nr:DUF4375 domain-containing protein [Actinomycetes bacterium]
MNKPSAWSIFEGLSDSDPSVLTEHQRLLVAFAGVRQEVSSGGFDSYFRNSYGDEAGSAVEAAMRVGCEALAALIAEGMSRVGPSRFPTDAGTRQELLDASGVEFEDLDEAFYALEADQDLEALMESLATLISD